MEFQAHPIFTRALVLTGLEITASHTQGECRIDSANLTAYNLHAEKKLYDKVKNGVEKISNLWMLTLHEGERKK